ncbi:MAG: ATP-dependent Clp protease ATP-binding subunit [bacterium]|nr:ATP-dependent Clp protease ATP-binding subunit [bacterium]
MTAFLNSHLLVKIKNVMFEKFNESARRSLFFARYEASRSEGHSIGLEHLLLGLLRESDEALVDVFSDCGLEVQALRSELLGGTVALERVSSSPDLPLAEESKRALAFAVQECESMSHEEVGTVHLLLGLLRTEDSTVSQLLVAHGVDLLKVREVEVEQRHEDGIDIASRATPTLREFSRDLTDLAKQGVFDPLIGRDREVERVIQILSRRTKNNPLLIGEAGVGKTAIVEGMATRIAERRVPSLLVGRRILALDLSLLVAGTKYRGQFEERLKSLLKEIQDHPEIIVFVDEVHALIGTGSAEGSLDAANILKPALSRSEITCIGATTGREYRRYVEKDRSLSRRFQAIEVLQPTQEETVAILEGVKGRYESFHGVTYSDEAIRSAVSHAGRYISDRYFPDKAIDVIDEAGARVKLRQVSSSTRVHSAEEDIERVVLKMKDSISRKDFERAVQYREEELSLREELQMLTRTSEAARAQDAIVTRDEVEEVVSSWTGIPVTSLKEQEADRLRRMELHLRERIVGQDPAINAVARAIRRSRLGVTSPNRPMGSLIFLGPSGVGKTEVARQLARFLFQDVHKLLRFDMSEYMEKHTVSRLIGSPPGYVGFEEGGQLSEQVRRNPYSVILLDEIEKAHADIYNLLLQVLEDGRLTDNYGNVVDFTNTLIIMTSNLGSRSFASGEDVGFGSSDPSLDKGQLEQIVDRETKRHFPPEFTNRIDDVVVFQPLTRDSMLEISGLLLRESLEHLTSRQIYVEFDAEVPSWLQRQCRLDPGAGARPMRRLVQRTVEDAIAEYLIQSPRPGIDGVHLRIQISDNHPVVLDERAAEVQESS